MEILFQSSGINTYLNVKIQDRETIVVNKFRIRMLEENKIECLLPPVFTEIDGALSLKYKVDTFYVLDRLFMKLKPDGDFLKLIMRQILDCIKSIEEYLLNVEDIVLQPEYMFYDYQRKELGMIYIPGYRKNIRLQLKQFVEYIMKVFDHRDKNGVAYLYHMYDIMAEDNFDCESLIRYTLSHMDIDSNAYEVAHEYAYACSPRGKKQAQREAESQPEKSSNERYMTIFILDLGAALVLAFAYFLGENKIDTFVVVGLLAIIIVNVVFFIPGRICGGVNFGNRQATNTGQNSDAYVDLNYSQPVNDNNSYTYIQSVDSEIISQIVPLTNGGLEVAELGKFGDRIVIGRSKKETDYRIPVTQVSRVHAQIFKKGEGYYIQDLNSTNGTFLNYVRLQEQQIEKLKKGDLITFANEEFFVS